MALAYKPVTPFTSVKLILSFLMLFLLFPGTKIYSQIIINYPASAQSLTRGLGSSTLSVQVGITSTCNNDTVTISLPASVTYVPGSVTKTAGTQTIAEGNISNLRKPQFVISNVSSTGDVSFTILRRAGCGSLASGKDSVAVKGSCGSAQEISGIVNTYNIYSPSLSINPPAAIVNSVILRTYTRTLSITNGGNGDADTVFFYIVYPSQGLINTTGTNTIVANSVSFVPYKTTGDTFFYRIFGATIFGGNNLLSNGESISISEPIKVAKCNVSTTYGAGWGTNNKLVCGYQTRTSSVSMVTAVANFSAISMSNTGYTDKCTTYDVNVSITNGGTGNDTAAGMYDVKLYWGYCYPSNPTVWSGFNTNLMTITNGRINGNTITTFVVSGSLAQMDLRNLFVSDPDGAGGLEDLDGDGFYDDLRRGNTVTYTIALTNKCNLACNTDRIHYPGATIEYRSMCTNTRVVANCMYYGNATCREYESAMTTTGYVPANITGGVAFRIKLKFNYYSNFSNYWNSNSRYQYFVKLPAGISVASTPNAKYGLSAVSYVQSNDTIFITSPSNVEDTAGINLVLTCGSSGTKTFNYGIKKLQNISTGCGCRAAMACGSFFTLAHCPSTCSAGPTNYVPVVRRTDASLGWTSSTMATRQVASAVSAYELSKALYLDTIQITGSAYQNSNVNNLHLELTLGRTGTTNKLTPLDIQTNIIRGGSSVASYTINTYTNNSSGSNQIVDWDLSSGLPSGAMLAGDSVITVSRYVVSDNATLPQQDIQSGGTWNYYSIISGVRQGCNTPVPEMYLVGTTLIDGRNGWYANGCSPVSDNASNLARRFNTSGSLYSNEYRPGFYIDSFVVTYPSTFTPGNVSSSGFYSGTIAPSAIRGNVRVFVNPGTWNSVPLTVTNAYGARVAYAMSPSCKSATNQVHNVKFYIRDYYYALASRATYPSTYKYVGCINANLSANIASSPAGMSQTIVYNGAQKPILGFQNLTGTVIGTAQQHTWDVQLNNTGLSTAQYIWFAIEKAGAGLISIDSVRSLTGNLTISPTSYGTGNKWYQVSTAGIPVAGVHNLRVYFKYSSCNPDSILVKSGWNCAAYPSPDPVSDTTVCSQTASYLKVIPDLSEVQLSVARQPGNGSTISLCTIDSVIVQVNSAQSANLLSPRVEVYPPAGVTVSSPAMVEYPLGSGNWQAISASAIVSGVSVNLNGHTGISTNGLPGTTANPGAAGRQASVKLYYSTGCALTSGSSFTFKTYGNKPCGQPAIGDGVITKSSGINITGASVSGGIGLTTTLSSDTFRCTTPVKTLSLSTTPVLTSTQSGDTVFYTLPEGLAYKGNFTAGSNCASCNVSTSAGLLGTTIVKVKLETGITAGNTLLYSFDVGPDVSSGCGNTYIEAAARRQIAPLMCGSTTCTNSSVIIGTASKPIVIYKPDLTFASYNGKYVTGIPQFIYKYGGTITNQSAVTAVPAGTSVIMETWWDLNMNNLFDSATDRLVRTKTLTSGIAANGGTLNFADTFQYTGGLSPDPTRAMFTVIRTSTSPNCNCTPLIMSSLVYDLPLNWLNFTATRQQNNSVWLNWSVAQETDVNHYEIERKITGETQFKTIGTVPASGLNNAAYSFTDANSELLKDVVYYRIKSVDANGNHEYSDIRSVVFRDHATAANTFAFWPNPAHTLLNISVAAEDGFSYSISNSTGQVLLKGACNQSFCTTDVSSLNNGVYILTVTDSHTGKSEKLVISR